MCKYMRSPSKTGRLWFLKLLEGEFAPKAARRRRIHELLAHSGAFDL